MLRIGRGCGGYPVKQTTAQSFDVIETHTDTHLPSPLSRGGAFFRRGIPCLISPQELVNGLKTDRRLLSLAVALIYNCCLPLGGSRGLERAKDRDGIGPGSCLEWNGGQERLRQLTADKAFCCLLMKVCHGRLHFESRTDATRRTRVHTSAAIKRKGWWAEDTDAVDTLSLYFIAGWKRFPILNCARCV